MTPPMESQWIPPEMLMSQVCGSSNFPTTGDAYQAAYAGQWKCLSDGDQYRGNGAGVFHFPGRREPMTMGLELPWIPTARFT